MSALAIPLPVTAALVPPSPATLDKLTGMGAMVTVPASLVAPFPLTAALVPPSPATLDKLAQAQEIILARPQVPVAENPVTILSVPVAAIFDAPNAADLIQAYAAACIAPGAEPQRQLYDAMEKAGVIHAFGAYVDLAGSPRLVGFASVICSVMPHDGHLVASLGEMFIDLPYRGTNAEGLLLSAVEQRAADVGCRCFICQARIGSGYDKRLSLRAGFSPTFTQYIKWLNGYGGRA
jgi:GNAT superfamily N-acetyltransferase